MKRNMKTFFTFAAEGKITRRLNKSKLGANSLIAILMIGLFAGLIVSNASFSHQASAQPPVPVPNVTVSTSGGSAVTDANGHYNIASYLNTGTYTVTTTAEGYVDTEVDNVAVTAGVETTGINILIGLSGIITGKVTDAATGNPLQGIFVTAENATGADQVGDYAITDSSGNYRMDTNLPTGTYNITADDFSGPHIIQTATGVSVTAGATTANENFALPKSAVITGTVTDSVSGQPISGVLVEAVSSDNLYGASATTNSLGQYTLNNNLGTDSYNISALFPTNHLSGGAATLVAATAGQTTSGVNFALAPSGIISGKVTNSNGGAPIAGVSVEASSDSGAYFGFATTDSSGNYQITTGLGTDTYTVSAFYESIFTSNPGIAVAEGQTTANVNFQLAVPASGTITGKVTDATTGNPIAGASVDASNTVTFQGNSATTDASGDYTISTQLPSGTYTVTATMDEYGQQVQNSVTVTAGAVTSGVNFQLTAIPSGSIEGTVTAEQLAAPTPTPPPTATPTPPPTATPTPPPTATPTPPPTAITTPPTAAPTASPAVTAKPTVTPSPTPKPTATPAPTTKATPAPTAKAGVSQAYIYGVVAVVVIVVIIASVLVLRRYGIGKSPV